MKTKTQAPKTPKQIAESKLRDSLSLLSANASSASALAYTHGVYLPLETIMAMNEVVLRMSGDIKAIQASLEGIPLPIPA